MSTALRGSVVEIDLRRRRLAASLRLWAAVALMATILSLATLVLYCVDLRF